MKNDIIVDGSENYAQFYFLNYSTIHFIFIKKLKKCSKSGLLLFVGG